MNVCVWIRWRASKGLKGLTTLMFPVVKPPKCRWKYDKRRRTKEVTKEIFSADYPLQSRRRTFRDKLSFKTSVEVWFLRFFLRLRKFKGFILIFKLSHYKFSPLKTFCNSIPPIKIQNCLAEYIHLAYSIEAIYNKMRNQYFYVYYKV